MRIRGGKGGILYYRLYLFSLDLVYFGTYLSLVPCV